MRMSNFNVGSKIMDDMAVIYPKGYLNNITGEDLVDACNDYIEKGIKKIVLNFGETEFINSIGISMLLTIIERLKECKGTLCFTDMSKMYRETFEMLGLTKFIKIFADEHEALTHLRSIGSNEPRT
ncbi:MAG: STAS domain-containing protein [Nitrospirota bacterium]